MSSCEPASSEIGSPAENLSTCTRLLTSELRVYKQNIHFIKLLGKETGTCKCQLVLECYKNCVANFSHVMKNFLVPMTKSISDYWWCQTHAGSFEVKPANNNSFTECILKRFKWLQASTQNCPTELLTPAGRSLWWPNAIVLTSSCAAWCELKAFVTEIVGSWPNCCTGNNYTTIGRWLQATTVIDCLVRVSKGHFVKSST